MTKEVSVTVGPGLITLLAAAIFILKLTGHIDWSWLVVLTAVFWLPLMFMAVGFALIGAAFLIFLTVTAILEWLTR